MSDTPRKENAPTFRSLVNRNELARLLNEYPNEAQKRIIVVITGTTKDGFLSPGLLQEISREAVRPWWLEHLLPVPVLTCRVEDASVSSIEGLIRKFANKLECRIVAAHGTVEYGIHDFGSRRMSGSFGKILAVVVAAAFQLDCERSWVDQFIKHEVGLFECTDQPAVIAGHEFFSMTTRSEGKEKEKGSG